jgi:sulfate transport system ATP-binding protein
MSILIDNISKAYGQLQILDHVNLEVKSGSLLALVGPSGSGKSSLLRIIAGFEMPDEGRIWLSGKDCTETSVQNRNVGFVFQNYALFNGATVYENVAFGLMIRDFPLEEIEERVEGILQVVQLSALKDRYPTQLSGGQRQRVALARVLTLDPRLLLLDEPFGALDARVRQELRIWLRRLHDDIPVTTIFVTHDQQEAMEVADQIAIFYKGRIEQIGRPAEIYHQPASQFVMEFTGGYNYWQVAGQYRPMVDSIEGLRLPVKETEFNIVTPELESTQDRIIGDFQTAKITSIFFSPETVGDKKMVLDLVLMHQGQDQQPLECLMRIIVSRAYIIRNDLKIGDIIKISPNKEIIQANSYQKILKDLNEKDKVPVTTGLLYDSLNYQAPSDYIL